MPPKRHKRHHEDKHGQEKDVRRAFEHLSRVGLLRTPIDNAQAKQIEARRTTRSYNGPSQ